MFSKVFHIVHSLQYLKLKTWDQDAAHNDKRRSCKENNNDGKKKKKTKTSKVKIAITIATRKWQLALKTDWLTHTSTFAPVFLWLFIGKNNAPKTKTKKITLMSRSSQQGQAKPSRDMNHRDSHAMSTRGAAHCSHSAAYQQQQQRRHLFAVWGRGDTGAPITRHYLTVPYTMRLALGSSRRRWLIRYAIRGGQLVGGSQAKRQNMRGSMLTTRTRLISSFVSVPLSLTLPLSSFCLFSLAACPVWIRFSVLWLYFGFVFVVSFFFLLFCLCLVCLRPCLRFYLFLFMRIHFCLFHCTAQSSFVCFIKLGMQKFFNQLLQQ